jgi:hypothetical protein
MYEATPATVDPYTTQFNSLIVHDEAGVPLNSRMDTLFNTRNDCGTRYYFCVNNPMEIRPIAMFPKETQTARNKYI